MTTTPEHVVSCDAPSKVVVSFTQEQMRQQVSRVFPINLPEVVRMVDVVLHDPSITLNQISASTVTLELGATLVVSTPLPGVPEGRYRATISATGSLVYGNVHKAVYISEFAITQLTLSGRLAHVQDSTRLRAYVQEVLQQQVLSNVPLYRTSEAQLATIAPNAAVVQAALTPSGEVHIGLSWDEHR